MAVQQELLGVVVIDPLLSSGNQQAFKVRHSHAIGWIVFNAVFRFTLGTLDRSVDVALQISRIMNARRDEAASGLYGNHGRDLQC